VALSAKYISAQTVGVLGIQFRSGCIFRSYVSLAVLPPYGHDKVIVGSKRRHKMWRDGH